jgi:hypothetical protein
MLFNEDFMHCVWTLQHFNRKFFITAQDVKTVKLNLGLIDESTVMNVYMLMFRAVAMKEKGWSENTLTVICFGLFIFKSKKKQLGFHYVAVSLLCHIAVARTGESFSITR